MSSARISYESFATTAPTARAALLTMGKTADESGLDIASVTDREGRGVTAGHLRLRLQTIGHVEGYWLDTGILLGS